ncbi:hypothetical protein HNP46_006771 [Pseudomonas nitritireducens]|uniref:Uncharacterized protein n=1 Tax=Pseudomonas nitroreducens TaxID=46680 RepID=A0A7W7KRZ1_PSENT|nr:hypothetical protein [Pseudomonas nitritireducens]MBB4867852.1 hypothetical protein [Pseudomonas nitritireducens]
MSDDQLNPIPLTLPTAPKVECNLHTLSVGLGPWISEEVWPYLRGLLEILGFCLLYFQASILLYRPVYHYGLSPFDNPPGVWILFIGEPHLQFEAVMGGAFPTFVGLALLGIGHLASRALLQSICRKGQEKIAARATRSAQPKDSEA